MSGERDYCTSSIQNRMAVLRVRGGDDRRSVQRALSMRLLNSDHAHYRSSRDLARSLQPPGEQLQSVSQIRLKYGPGALNRVARHGSQSEEGSRNGFDAVQLTSVGNTGSERV